MSVEDAESRRFELAFGCAFLRPTSAQDLPRNIFSGFFKKFETFVPKFCAHSERYRNLMAGISEIPTFF